MNTYDTFANNLRRFCEQYPSIAAVCAATQINRQQFNKYLSGKVLPSAIVLRKICKFLNVSEQALFASEGAQAPHGKARSGIPKIGKAQEVFESARGFASTNTYKNSSDVSSMPEGYYFCYFPLESRKQKLLRSLVWVFRQNDVKGFVRITYIRDFKKRSNVRAGGRHTGIVFANQDEIFMLGFNRYSEGQMSIATIDRPKSQSFSLLLGLTVTRNLEKLAALRMVMVQVDSQMTKRQMIDSIGIVDENDPTLQAEILAALPELQRL